MEKIPVPDDSQIEAIVAMHNLDRRIKYSSFEGFLCKTGVVTMPCTGCNEWGEMGGRHYDYGGCRECGYTGKRKNHFPIMIDLTITKEE